MITEELNTMIAIATHGPAPYLGAMPTVGAYIVARSREAANHARDQLGDRLAWKSGQLLASKVGFGVDDLVALFESEFDVGDDDAPLAFYEQLPDDILVTLSEGARLLVDQSQAAPLARSAPPHAGKSWDDAGLQAPRVLTHQGNGE